MIDSDLSRPLSHAGRGRIATRSLADPTRIGRRIARRPASTLRTTAATNDSESII